MKHNGGPVPGEHSNETAVRAEPLQEGEVRERAVRELPDELFAQLDRWCEEKLAAARARGEA